MKLVLASLVFAFASLAANADAPGYGYPQNQPGPIEELIPEQPIQQPCVAPCVPLARPNCIPPYGCGNVYNQIPQKICQIVRVRQTRYGLDWAVVRAGQVLSQPKHHSGAEADALHYQRIRDMDGRPVCEAVY